jgi:hypothetical protein
MTNIDKGIIAGIAFGIVSIIPMFFMKFENKHTAIIASFISRFSIGFIIFNLNVPGAGWLKGIIVGLVLSIPDALITKQYKPIIGLGIVGGLVCGLFI